MKKDTDIQDPDGSIFDGEKIGHVNEKNIIRKRDGIILPGEKIGYVDEKGNVRRPDIILRGEKVGKIKGVKAHDVDGPLFSGEEWGYVDDEGNIRQKDFLCFKGRIIGKMKGTNKAAALGYFILRFKEIEDRARDLENEIRNAAYKVAYLHKVQNMIKFVPEARALGDFDGLMSKLKGLEDEILNQIKYYRYIKEDIVKQAENICYSTEWKKIKDLLKALLEKWKHTPSPGRECENELWQRFRSAQDVFSKRRAEHYDNQKRIQEQNQYQKEQICSAIEALIHATNTTQAIIAAKQLQAQWRTIGPVPKHKSDALWNRYRHACDEVFNKARKERERRAAEWERANRERLENQRKKESLCSTAESLCHSSDVRSAKEHIKELQAEWKTIGQVPKEQAQCLWERFRHACDRVFQNAKAEHERMQEEWRNRLHDILEHKRDQARRLRESIDHDEGNIERWRDIIYNLHEGGRADEIRDSLEDKISDVKDKIRSKEDRLSDLEDSINEIERKLY